MLDIDPTTKLIGQWSRWMALNRRHKVKKRTRSVTFSQVHQTSWVFLVVLNIVVIPNKCGPIMVCKDFTNLNKVCPKHPYPLLQISNLIDVIFGYQWHISWWFLWIQSDANAWYKSNLHFLQYWQGTLQLPGYAIRAQNKGVTYLYMMNTIFKDGLGNIIKVYIDEVVKSKRRHGHAKHLQTFFDKLFQHNMR